MYQTPLRIIKDTCVIYLHIGNWDQISENDTFDLNECEFDLNEDN